MAWEKPECPSDSALQGLVHVTLGPSAQLTTRKWREAALPEAWALPIHPLPSGQVP